MKIQLLSDTHGSPYALHPEADVIAHAGDFAPCGSFRQPATRRASPMSLCWAITIIIMKT
ncbi:hypothetical protein [Neisseria sicca]|uniref:hypothetical protein n=1 Tax=Neisseria sicca TaxID=490 RepID=UPI0028801ECD|nr:hypothetical protein [Neisseria sicca]